MIELHVMPSLAPVPGGAHERALPSVPLPDGALHVRRYMPRIVRPAALPRPRGRREPALAQLAHVTVERPAEDLSDVRRRSLVAREFLSLPQVGVHVGRHRQLQRVALGSASGLPSGLSINPSSGLISGQAQTLGTYPVQLSVSDNQPTPLTASKKSRLNRD